MWSSAEEECRSQVEVKLFLDDVHFSDVHKVCLVFPTVLPSCDHFNRNGFGPVQVAFFHGGFYIPRDRKSDRTYSKMVPSGQNY